MNKISRKRHFQLGFAAALAAGVVASLVMVLLSILGYGISLPEVFSSELTALTPLSVFAYLHQLIGGDAKYYLFAGIFIGQCLVFAVSGTLFNLRFSSQGQRLQWYQGLLLALILWLLVGFVFLPLTGAGIFGAQLSVGIIKSLLSLALVGVVFGLLFVFAQNWLVARSQVSKDEKRIGRQATIDPDEAERVVTRRRLLRDGIVIAGIGLLGVGLWRFITEGATSARVPVDRLMQHFTSKITPPPVPNYGVIQPARFLSPEITSNDQYYVVSKNLVADPTVNASSWSLTVDGQVEHPFTLNYSQVLALPMQKQYESMMCVSNDVGGPYMSNALWRGVPLKDLLSQAGIKPGATKVVFYAVDDYSDSIHLSKALEPTTLMAVYMNGMPLPQEHGFPARMLVPGIYGMKHCKWLTHIQVVNYDFQGYWQQRGWSDAAPVRMTARIDTPLDGMTIAANKTTYIAGVAFSGNRGISEVDVSTDGGQTWQIATLKQPPSAITWVLWELAWQPRPGNYLVVARAIDLAGNVQSPIEAPPLPDGSSGYHAINIVIS